MAHMNYVGTAEEFNFTVHESESQCNTCGWCLRNGRIEKMSAHHHKHEFDVWVTTLVKNEAQNVILIEK